MISNKSILVNTLWSSGGYIVTLIISFITNIYIANIIDPVEFGKIAIVMFYITISNIISEGGLSGALIRKKDYTNNDISTVFIFNLIISIVCFILLISTSHLIANFYNEKELIKIINILSLVLIINAFQFVQNSLLVIKLKFKEKSVIFFISTLLSSIIGITYAHYKPDVWALVYLQLSSSIIYTVILWIYEGFFFSLKFDKTSFRSLYKFGINTTISSIISSVFDNIYQLIIGKLFSIKETGFLYQAKRIQDIFNGIVNMVLQSVIFSSLAKVQTNKDEFKKLFDNIKISTAIIISIFCCITFTFSEQIILILFGKQWIGSVFYLKLFSIYSIFYIQELVYRLIYKVYDKTNYILLIEILKKIIQIITIGIGLIFKNINVLLIGFVISSFIGYIITFQFSKKIIDDKKNKELVLLVKLLFISSICIILFSYINSILKFNPYTLSLIIPCIFIYIILIHVLKVINLKKIIQPFLHVK